MSDFDFWHVYRYKRKEQGLFINRFSEKKKSYGQMRHLGTQNGVYS